MKRIKVFLFNGFLLTTTALIIRTVGMSFSIYISNKIGTEAVGIYQLVMSIYMFFITLGSSGINLATTRIISERLAISTEYEIHIALKKCLKYSFIMGLTSCVILFFSSSIFSTYWLHSKLSCTPLRIISISLPFLSMSACINGYFSAIGNVKKTAFAQILEQGTQIALVTMFLNFFMPDGLEYACISLVFGSTISEILSFVFIIFSYLREKKALNFITFSKVNYTKQILRIAVPISFTSYIRSGLSTLKQLLVPTQLEKSGMSCSYALSCYGIINGMAMPLILFPCSFVSSFNSLLVPEFSYMKAKGSKQKINFSINKILKFCFIFSFLIMGMFWCFSEELSTFIYKNNDVSKFVKILCPLIVLMYIDNIVDSILKGLDKEVNVMLINILDLLSCVIFIYFLLPKYAIYGYIFVIFFSEFLNGIFSLLLLVKETKLKIDFANWVLKPLLSIFLISFVFKNYTVGSIFELVLQITFFTTCYFLVIILLKGIVKEDIFMNN